MYLGLQCQRWDNVNGHITDVEFCDEIKWDVWLRNGLCVKCMGVTGVTIPSILYVLKRLFNWTNLSLFYFLFYYSWFLNYSSTDTSYYYFFDLLLFNYCYLEFYLSYLRRWLLTCLFALIGLMFIDPETCPRVWLKIVCGPYPNRTYKFASPAGLWKAMARVPVGCSDLFASIDCFVWCKITFKFFVRAFFCLSLTCVYHIYWISVHWSWNLSSSVIANCQWAICKPDVRIFSPTVLWNVMARVPVFVI